MEIFIYLLLVVCLDNKACVQDGIDYLEDKIDCIHLETVPYDKSPTGYIATIELRCPKIEEVEGY